MQRDYILNEIEKITLTLARLAGLKETAKPDEFIQLADDMLQNEYNISLDELLDLDNAEFELLLEKENYPADKLDALAQLLCLYYEPFSVNDETLAGLKKIIAIFDLLEQKHHISSFENINKRSSIYKFLQNNYE